MLPRRQTATARDRRSRQCLKRQTLLRRHIFPLFLTAAARLRSVGFRDARAATHRVQFRGIWVAGAGTNARSGSVPSARDKAYRETPA